MLLLAAEGYVAAGRQLTSRTGVVGRVAGFAVEVIHADGEAESIRCGAQFNLFNTGDPILVVRDDQQRCVRLVNRRSGVMLRLAGGHTLLSSFTTARIALAWIPGLGAAVSWPYWRHWMLRWREGDRTLAVMTSLVVVAIGLLSALLPMLVSNATAAEMQMAPASAPSWLLWPVLAAVFWPGLYMSLEILVDALRTLRIDRKAWALEAQHPLPARTED